MKKICFAFAFVFSTTWVFGQTNDSAKLSPRIATSVIADEQLYQGFVIRLIPNNTTGFGFDILTERNLAAHHFQNPLPFFPAGTEQPDDAFKIAKWIVSEYLRTGHWQNSIPPHQLSKLNLKAKSRS